MGSLNVRAAHFAEVCEVLQSTFGDDRQIIEQEVKQGVAQCWQIGQAAAITRREGPELVVVCLAGRGGLEAGRVICQAAKAAGCETIRFHTKRPALGRMMAPLGAALREYVYEIRCQ